MLSFSLRPLLSFAVSKLYFFLNVKMRYFVISFTLIVCRVLDGRRSSPRWTSPQASKNKTVYSSVDEAVTGVSREDGGPSHVADRA